MKPADYYGSAFDEDGEYMSRADVARKARVELLEELIDECCYDDVGDIDYLRGRLKEAKTK
jgi:hypothetical protein